MISTLIRLGLLALFITALSGCSGSDGAAGPAGATGATGPQGASGVPGATAVNYSEQCLVCHGAGRVADVEVVHGQTMNPDPNVATGTDASTMTSTQWANAQLAATVTSATINGTGQPVVTFAVTNNGQPLKGLGNTSGTTNLANLGFAIAKLVPANRTNTCTTNVWECPSHWVSYMVVNASGTVGKPSSENYGTLVDNGDGTYVYTFKTVIDGVSASNVQATVAAFVDTATSKKADLGDLSYQPTLTHRIGVMIFGAARNTGTNNSTGSATGFPAAVNIKTPVNAFYDFNPSTATQVAQSEPNSSLERNVVDVKNCMTCHVKFTFHGGDAMKGTGGSRQDTRMCALCHTDQRKFGAAVATVNMTVTPPTISTGDKLSTTGASMKNLPVWIHKIHNGENLVLTGYNDNLTFDARFPQDLRNCIKCHSNATGSTNAPQAANYTLPSRLVCGSCHDGINFVDATGIRLEDKYQDDIANRPVGTTASGHGAGMGLTDDSGCPTCHSSGAYPDVAVAHKPISPIDPTWTVGGHTNSSAIAGINSTNLPAGAIKIAYDLNSVTLNASANPVLRFRFLDITAGTPGTPVVFNTQPASAPSTANINSNNVVELMNNFVGGPNAYVMAAVPQDGITPADFNASASVYIRNCWNKVLPATTCTMAADGTTGYYILTMTGTKLPTSAAMVTGGIGFNDGAATTSMPLTQTNVTVSAAVGARKPVPAIQVVNASSVPVATTITASNVTATNATDVVKGYVGGLNVPATPVTKVLSGTLPAGFTTAATTARRSIVEKARCDNCHNSLGTFTFANFHGGQRNDPDRCVLCHDANRTNNGWNLSSNAHVHAIHSAGKRQVDNGPNFTWTATDANGGTTGPAVDGFFNIGYPGVLRNCQSCHLPGTVNFGNSANATQATQMGFKTVCSGIMGGTATAPNSTLTTMAPYVTAGTNCGSGFSASLATGTITNAAGTTLVNSPITNACFSCHTTDSAASHMKGNGGTLYTSRNTVAGGTYTGTLAKPVVSAQ